MSDALPPRPWSQVPADEQTLIMHGYITGQYRSLPDIAARCGVSIYGLQEACASGGWVKARDAAQDSQLDEHRQHFKTQNVMFGSVAATALHTAMLQVQAQLNAASQAGDSAGVDLAISRLTDLAEKWEKVKDTVEPALVDPREKAEERRAAARAGGGVGAIPVGDVPRYRQLVGSFVRMSLERFSAERQQLISEQQPEPQVLDAEGTPGVGHAQPYTMELPGAPAPPSAFPHPGVPDGTGNV